MAELSSVAMKTVTQTVGQHLDNRTVEQVQDRSVWIRHDSRITLGGCEIVYLKLAPLFPGSEKESHICGLLRDRSTRVGRGVRGRRSTICWLMWSGSERWFSVGRGVI